MKIFGIMALILLLMCIQCNRYSQPSTNTKIAVEIGKFIAETYGLIPCGVGGGKTKKGLPLVIVGFIYKGKLLNIEEGRKLFIEVLEDSLEFIKENQKNINNFQGGSFTYENIDLSIYCFDPQGNQVFDPYLDIIGNYSNKIGYSTQDPNDRYKKKQKIYETYDEAFEKLENEKVPSFKIK